MVVLHLRVSRVAFGEDTEMNLDLMETGLTQQLAALMAAFEHDLSKLIEKEYAVLLDSVFESLTEVAN
jgi:hypothetical protein